MRSACLGECRILWCDAAEGGVLLTWVLDPPPTRRWHRPKISGIGRKNHQLMLDQYSQIKNVRVGTDESQLGFF